MGLGRVVDEKEEGGMGMAAAVLGVDGVELGGKRLFEVDCERSVWWVMGGVRRGNTPELSCQRWARRR